MTVNKEAIEQLAVALESGEFQQGKSYLEKDGRYCCLGVACIVAQRAGVIETLPWDRETDDPGYADLVLPDDVREWYGFASVDPVLYRTEDIDWIIRATAANDGKELTFGQIARKFREAYLGDEVIVDPNP